MTPTEAAEARAAGYRLLAQLLQGPLTAELVAAAAIDPRLVTTQALDDLAVQHLSAFEQGAFPHAGVFLEDEPGVGGATATACADLWRRLGLPEERWLSAPDHLGAHLHALAWLCGAEADAHGDEAGDQAERMRQLQGEVLDDLLRWLPQWVIAVDDGWCAALATVIGELTVHHRLALMASGVPLPLPADDGPGAQDLDLTALDTGVREIASFLAAPARCGLLLTSRHITTICRALDTPAGFGPRRQRLGTLLRSAARFKTWPALIEQLLGTVQHTEAALRGAPWIDLEGLTVGALRRLTHTRGALRALRLSRPDLLDPE